nr:MAG TPA: hypothetical protein [Caudoviricetes sp.]
MIHYIFSIFTGLVIASAIDCIIRESWNELDLDSNVFIFWSAFITVGLLFCCYLTRGS